MGIKIARCNESFVHSPARAAEQVPVIHEERFVRAVIVLNEDRLSVISVISTDVYYPCEPETGSVADAQMARARQNFEQSSFTHSKETRTETESPTGLTVPSTPSIQQPRFLSMNSFVTSKGFQSGTASPQRRYRSVPVLSLRARFCPQRLLLNLTTYQNPSLASTRMGCELPRSLRTKRVTSAEFSSAGLISQRAIRISDRR